jgi:hypothetical protein
MLKNKRADAQITILVFMVLVLCIFSLLIFILTNNQVEKKITNAAAPENFYSNEGVFEYYLFNLARKTYLQNTLASPEQFIIDFKKYYALDSQKIYSEEFYWNQIANNKYEIAISPQVLYFKLVDFNFRQSFSISKSQEVREISRVYNISFSIYSA